jgi:AAA+ superfamily predicted ATPase
MDPDSSLNPSQQPIPLDLAETPLLPPKPPATVEELAALLQAGKVDEFNALRSGGEIVFKKLNFSRAIMNGAHLSGCIFESCDFNQCSLVNAKLLAALFKGCVITGTYFDGASCTNAGFERCSLSGVHFQSCGLIRTEFRSSDLSRCNFESAWLEGGSIQTCQVNLCNFDQVSGKNLRVQQSRLWGTHFSGSDLVGSAFVQTSGERVSFDRSNLTNATFNGSWWQDGFSVNDAYLNSGALMEHMFQPRIWDDGKVIKAAYTDQRPPKGMKFGSLKVGVDTIKTLVDGIPGTDKELYDEAMVKLHALVGLDEVKREVNQLAATLRVARHRQLSGAPADIGTMHYVFSGPSGTGKTTVARIFGDILKSLGYLSKGHFVETDRSGLVGRYLGETGLKTKATVEAAAGGVLFIDEAYTLAPNNDQDQYAQEALATLLKLMEDMRHDLVVIVAGYEKEMGSFIRANPGLQSRFANSLQFSDLSQAALSEVARNLMDEAGFKADEGTLRGISKVLSMLKERDGELFGNGRAVRNIYEKMLRRQAVRLTKDGGDLTNANLDELIFEDIPCQELLHLSFDQLRGQLENERVSDFEQGLEALFRARMRSEGARVR